MQICFAWRKLDAGYLSRFRQRIYRAALHKVLVLTNYATADIRQRCLRLGADAVFDKSTEIEGFLEVCAAM